jgi:hypothetical protein
MGPLARARAASAAAVVLASGVAGCGGEAGAQRPTLADGQRTALVDPRRPPYVNALVRRDDGTLLLTTNRGLWRVARGRATRLSSQVVAGRDRVPVGTFLQVADVGTGELLGSGHPDAASSPLPQFLGVLRSRDGARTWEPVQRLGRADLHVIRRRGDTLYAWDAVLGAVLVADLRFGAIRERFTPPELLLDLVVDPADGDRLLIATERGLYRSADQGRSWRPLEPRPGVRLSWLPGGALFRTTAEGAWERSADAGGSWEPVGRLPGEPWRIASSDAAHHDVALADGSIASTADGGRTWRVVFDAR